jgi:hypothetical protein
MALSHIGGGAARPHPSPANKEAFSSIGAGASGRRSKPKILIIRYLFMVAIARVGKLRTCARVCLSRFWGRFVIGWFEGLSGFRGPDSWLGGATAEAPSVVADPEENRCVDRQAGGPENRTHCSVLTPGFPSGWPRYAPLTQRKVSWLPRLSKPVWPGRKPRAPPRPDQRFAFGSGWVWSSLRRKP